LDERPVNWKELRLKNVLVGPLTNGLFKRSDDFGTGVPLVNVSDVYSPDGLINSQRLDRVRASSGEIETFKVHSGDLFFVRSSLKLEGTGRCALADVVEPGTVFECHIVRARPDKRKMNPRFLTLFLSSWIGVNNTISRANTVTMSTLDQGAIASLPILVPPMVEQIEILNFVDVESAPIIDAVSRLKREIEFLREYRTRLIADLVNGKVDVRQAVSALPEVLLDADNGAVAVSMDSEQGEELAEEVLADQ
jgi:type I restriction enzyme S subunit